MLAEWNYRFDEEGREAFAEYVAVRRRQPHFANARSVRNALDRMRMRQALRLFEQSGELSAEDLMVISAPEVRASRVFDAGSDSVRSDGADAGDEAATGRRADHRDAAPGDAAGSNDETPLFNDRGLFRGAD